MQIPYLYKILSLDNWNKSFTLSHIALSSDDDHFIHFSTEEQLNRIIDKYWGNVSEYVILKLDAKKLPGRLVYEANPGGENKYYHLYEGSIPKEAIVERRHIVEVDSN